MSKQLKRSRIKGLPPKLQLDRRDFATGSQPSIARGSTDNRTGTYPVSWNDANTIVFGEQGSTPSLADSIIAYYKLSRDNLVSGSIDQKAGSVEFSPVFVGTTLTSSADSGLYNFRIDSQFRTTGKILTDDAPAEFNGFGKLDATPDTGWFDDERALFTSQMSNGFSYQGGSPGTYSFWYKLNDVSGIGFGREILGKYDVDYSAFRLILSSSLQLETRVYADLFDLNRYRRSVTDNPVVPVGEWIHICVAYDTASAIYINGELTDYQTAFVGAPGAPVDFPNVRIRFNTDEEGDGMLLNSKINEICFFNKRLTDDEVRQVYNNRSSLALNDYSGVAYPIGLSVESKWIETKEQTTSLIVPYGNVVKHIANDAVHFSPGQDLKPFRDHDRPAVDGKSTGSSFYATGSTVVEAGEGFDQPLWSKSVIEFDFDIVQDASVGYRSGSAEGPDYAMMYLDPGQQTFQPIGSPAKWDEYEALYDDLIAFAVPPEDAAYAVAGSYLTAKAVGFEPFVPALATSPVENFRAQRPFSAAGFPRASKYSVSPTSSILVPLEGKIERPFLLEKIVIDFSGSHISPDFWSAAKGAAINTFFVLNQSQLKPPFSGSLPTSSSVGIYQELNPINLSASLDLVSFNQFAFLGYEESESTGPVRQEEIAALRQREIPFWFAAEGDDIEDIKRFDFSPQRWRVEGKAQVPTATDRFLYGQENISADVQSLTYANIQTGWAGGRNGYNAKGYPDARSFLRNMTGLGSISNFAGIVQLDNPVTNVQAPTPYILQPTDKLIFGFQCAYITKSQELGDPFSSGSINQGPTLTIHPGSFRVYLYGSYISEGSESHDTLNQLLTSVAIHEVIE